MIADGTFTGYIEARTAMRGRRIPARPWRERERRPGMTGAKLVDWARGMASRYPGQVQVH